MLLHELLRIPELLRLVSEILSKKDVVRVATASHGLFDLFMPHVWESVRGASQLFALIEGTETFRRVELQPLRVCETISLPKSVNEQILVRLRLYGSFVKSIIVFGDTSVRSGSNLEALAIFPDEGMQLEYADNPPPDFPSHFFQYNDTSDFHSFFRYVSNSLASLATTKFMLLQDGVLELLGSSTVLERLDIYQGDSSGDLSLSTLSLNVFPVLRHLGLLDFLDDKAIRDFYDTLPGTINRLTSLEIQYYNKFPDRGLPMTSLVSLICQGSPYLTDLSLQLMNGSNHGYIWQISPEILEALAVLPLQQLCIVSASINARLDSLAVLFPYLRSLKLPHHLIQLLELRELIEKMPHLEYLGIALQLGLVPTDIPAVFYSSALCVIESDFKEEARVTIRPALQSKLTHR
ncbi:hypothetical protein FRC06_006831 [Ceratobasidium sp. 370]|nr:hypothetical protein FRC06_006831 [Ceratobasidium sp. 370]